MALRISQIFIICQFSKPDYFLKICETPRTTLPIIPCMQYIVCSTYCIMEINVTENINEFTFCWPFINFSSRNFHDLAITTSMIVSKPLSSRYYSLSVLTLQTHSWVHTHTHTHKHMVRSHQSYNCNDNVFVITSLGYQRGRLIPINHWCHPPA